MRCLFIGLLVVIVNLAGCAQPSSENIPTFNLPPQTLNNTISVAQQLTFQFLDPHKAKYQVPTLNVLLEVDAKQLHLIALAWESRLFTMTWNGEALTTQQHIPLPSQLDASRILRDIQLAYWPVDELKKQLPSNWQIKQSISQRQLTKNNQIVVTIDYQTTPIWLGKTILTNFQEGYQLKLDTLPQQESMP